LLEVLLSGAILLTLMSIIAGVVKQYAQVDKAVDFGERARIVYANALNDILSEAQDAYEVVQPGSGAVASVLEFQRLDPRAQAARLPALPVPPAPLPLNWDPFPPSSRLTVRYFVLGDKLIRFAQHPDGSQARTEICEELSGFSAQMTPQSTLEVTLSTQSDGRIQTRSRTVVLPCL
jgi:hypothetical protein